MNDIVKQTKNNYTNLNIKLSVQRNSNMKNDWMSPKILPIDLSRKGGC